MRVQLLCSLLILMVDGGTVSPGNPLGRRMSAMYQNPYATQNNRVIQENSEVLIEIPQEHDPTADDQTVDEPIYVYIETNNSRDDQAQFEEGEPFNLEQFLASILKMSEEEEGQQSWGEPDWSLFEQISESQTEEEIESESPKSFYRLSEPPYIEEAPSMVTDWQQMMVNFNPDDMFSFDLHTGQTEILFQEVAKATTVRGAFYIPYQPITNRIDLTVKTLDDIEVFKTEDVQDGLFGIELEPGEYKFIFFNRFSEQPYYQVQFALDVHESQTDHLQHHDIDPLTERVDTMLRHMGDNYFKTKFMHTREDGAAEFMMTTHQKFLTFTVLETLAIVCVNLWQIFYIQGILQNKRLI